jgi:ElaB/YqjD/DUF883 family membrane-anchored ribosome-binding protein
MNDMEMLSHEASEKEAEIRGKANKVRHQFEDAGQQIKSKANDAWEDFIDLVRNHPGKALGITLATGVALGTFAAMSKRRRYSPSDHLQDLAGTGADAWQRVASGFGDAVATLKEAVEEAAAKFK